MRYLMLLLLAIGVAQAQDKDKVYRWTDSHGVVHYTDAPPEQNAKPVKLPPLQTYAPGKAPAMAQPAAPAAPEPVHTQVRVVAPAEGEIVEGENASVTVVAVIEAGGENAKGMLFYLDGKAASSTPSPSNSFTFPQVDRGEHTASAAVVGSDGKIIARATPVKFYRKQFSILNKPKAPPTPPKK